MSTLWRWAKARIAPSSWDIQRSLTLVVACAVLPALAIISHNGPRHAG